MGDLKIVKGNSFTTFIKIKAYGYDGEEILDFDVHDITSITVVIRVNSQNKVLPETDYELMDDNILKIEWDGKQALGPYLLEAFGVYKDERWRFFDKTPIFTIVDTNAEANIPQNSILDKDIYQITSAEVKITTAVVHDKLDYIGDDNYVYKYDYDADQYVKTDIYVRGDDGDSAYQVAIKNGFVGTEQEWLDSLKIDQTKLDQIDSRIDKLSNRIHVGQFNANNLTEEGWYDSITLGRPVGSESDEKYFLYMSSNGGQVCFSRRNSGKVYHRLGLEHPWRPVTHDDYGRLQANASALNVYPVSSQSQFQFSGNNIHTSGNCSEIYSGDDLSVTSFDLVYRVLLNPDDIVEVSCFYRRGNSNEGFNKYPQDSDAYLYITEFGEGIGGSDQETLLSDYIKIRSLGTLDQQVADGDHYQDLNTAEQIMATGCSKHYIKYTGTIPKQVYIHLAGDFSVKSSWLAIYNPGCIIHRAQPLDIIQSI